MLPGGTALLDVEPAILSVVIPTYHRPEPLARAVASVLAQELPEGTELEVVVAVSDRGSATDRAAAEALRADPRVRVVVADRAGPAAARNAALEVARGEVIGFTDDDCEARPGWLRAGLRALEGADMVQGRTVAASEKGPLDHAVTVEPPSWRWESCNLLVRRAAVEKAGPFDEEWNPTGVDGGHFGEDVEWGWRVVRAGARTAFAPNAVVAHAVVPRGRVEFLRYQAKLRHLPGLTRRVPEVRRALVGGVFVSPRHAVVVGSAALLVAGGVLKLAGRRPSGWVAQGVAVAAFGWPERYHLEYAADDFRPLAKALGWRLVDEGVQLAALVRGSIEARRLVL